MAKEEREIIGAEDVAEPEKANKELEAELARRARTEDALWLSEQRLRLAVRASNTGLWDWNIETGEIYFSPEWKSQIGYEDDELKNRFGEWEERLHPEDRDRMLKTVNSYLANPWSNYEVEFRLRHKDGSYRWILARATLLTDDQGKPQRMLGSHLDITERKLAEEAVRQSEMKFSTIFQTIPHTVAIVRLRDGVVLDVNDAWSQKTGYPKSEQIGKTSEELDLYVDPDVRKRQREALLETGEVHNLEGQYRVKDGSLRFGLTSAKILELNGEQCAVAMIRDITELKAAEGALRQSEAKFRALAETTPSAIVVYKLDDFTIRYVNPAMEVMSGYSQEELLRMLVWDLVHVDFHEGIKDRIDAWQTGELRTLRRELRLVTKGGAERWIDYSVGPIQFEGDLAMIVTAFDITARKQAEEALRQSEERYRLIVENQTEFIVKWLPDGTRTFVNESYCRYFDMREEDCLGSSFFPLVAPEFREAILNTTAALTPDAPEFTEEHLSIVPRGQRWQKWTSRGIFDANGNLIELLSTGRDITERKLAEQQVEQSREALRALSAHLQSVREEERTMIAREIHDELGQALTGLKMDLSYVQGGLTKAGLDRLSEKSTSMSTLIDATIQTVRRIATELRPGILDDLGLVAAIEWQAQDFQKRTGITCEFFPGIDDLDLDRERSTAAFRIFQETLTNVARHSGATEVDVRLDQSDDSVTLEIKDNGKGISEAESSGSKSLGLLGMRERAQLLGGELKITGTAGKGTTVKVRIPLS